MSTRGVIISKVPYGGAEVSATNKITLTAGGAEKYSDVLDIRRTEVHSIRLKVVPSAAITATPRAQISEDGVTWLEADPPANVVLLSGAATYEKVVSVSLSVAPFMRVAFPASALNNYDVEALQVWALQT